MNFKWECPYCRFEPPKTFKFAVSKALVDKFKAEVDPEEWEERVKAVKLIPRQLIPALNISDQMADPLDKIDEGYDLVIKYGNRHKLINNVPILKNGR